MSNTIISVGDTYRIFDSSVNTYKELPVGTYTINFSQMEGFSLSKVVDLEPPASKVYGDRESKAAKVMRSYQKMPRSLGVMLSGDKGQGKSMFLRMLADKAMSLGLPVVRVTRNYPGVADFIDSLGECAVVFDEFEKIFDKSEGDQNQFLPMFDGASSVKRLYCVTVNDLYMVSDYMVNRPGRFHYHLRFDYPVAHEIREYLNDQVDGIDESQVESVVSFSHRASINYDHLQAIAFELNSDPSTPVHELIEDINIKPIGTDRYEYKLFFSEDRVIQETSKTSPFHPDGEAVWFEGHGVYENVGFLPQHLKFDEDKGVMLVDGKHLIHNMNKDALARVGAPVKMEITLMGQRQYSYSSF